MGCATVKQGLSPAPGISLIMWNALYTAEKVIIRWTLLTEACYFGVQFLGECLPLPGCALPLRSASCCIAVTPAVYGRDGDQGLLWL